MLPTTSSAAARWTLLLAVSLPAGTFAQGVHDDLFDVPLAESPPVLAAVPADSRHPLHLELLRGTAVELYDGRQQPADFELVVIDPALAGDGLADHPLLLEAIAADVGILVLDASEADKAALRRHVGFATGGDALAYFFDLAQDRHSEIFELPSEWPELEEDLETVPIDAGRAPAAEAFQEAYRAAPGRHNPPPDDPRTVAKFVSDVFAYLDRTRLGDPETDAEGPLPPFPPDLKKWTFTYHGSAMIRPARRQVSQVDFEFIVAAILNNPPDGENFQFIYIQSNGIVVPGQMVHNSAYHKGWFQREFKIYLEPKDAPQVVWSASSPQNTAKVKNVTDKLDFNVAFDKSGVRSLFGFSSQSTRNIAEWEIIETTQGSRASWTYAQRTPFDGTRRACCAGAGRGCAINFWDKVKSPPVLSKHTMQVNTQALWRTTSVLSGEVKFEYELKQTLGNYHSHVIYHYCHAVKNKARNSFTVDLDKIR